MCLGSDVLSPCRTSVGTTAAATASAELQSQPAQGTRSRPPRSTIRGRGRPETHPSWIHGHSVTNAERDSQTRTRARPVIGVASLSAVGLLILRVDRLSAKGSARPARRRGLADIASDRVTSSPPDIRRLQRLDSTSPRTLTTVQQVVQTHGSMSAADLWSESSCRRVQYASPTAPCKVTTRPAMAAATITVRITATPGARLRNGEDISLSAEFHQPGRPSCWRTRTIGPPTVLPAGRSLQPLSRTRDRTLECPAGTLTSTDVQSADGTQLFTQGGPAVIGPRRRGGGGSAPSWTKHVGPRRRSTADSTFVVSWTAR